MKQLMQAIEAANNVKSVLYDKENDRWEVRYFNDDSIVDWFPSEELIPHLTGQ